MKTYFRWVLLIGLLLSLSFTLPLAAQDKGYFPTTEWRTSTPEEQGMDSVALAEFIEQVPKLGNIDSLMVVRNGYVVAEVYWHPFQSGMKREMMSASKSVISALVGIALDKGYIKSLDQKVLDFFPGMDIKNLDDNKRAITLRHLLTMTSGFKCEITQGTDTPTSLYLTNPAATQANLDWKMAGKPGTRWRYCQINVYLLSDILTQTTGMDTLAFAKQYLFAPLGITDVSWNVSAEGKPLGFAGLMLSPRDMAKVGYLFEREGRWEDKQIIPADWVKASIQNYAPKNPWSIPNVGYGYLWWLYHTPSGDFFEAQGAYFQYIHVSLEKQLVVVNTATDMTLGNANSTRPVFMETILKAVKSDKSLPPNAQGVARLEAAIQAAAKPTAQPIGVLPPIATTITGETYVLTNSNLLLAELDVLRLPEKDWQIATLGLDFGEAEATLRLQTVSGLELKLPVGLDGVYRLTTSRLGTLAAQGSWSNDKVFILYLRRLEQGPVLKYILIFTQDGLSGNVASARPGDVFAPSLSILSGQMMTE